jgi:alkyl sulfatase BDS1-like metallo-beta-lactamase superfamily hydrolase
MGGRVAALEKARGSFATGEYRWAATVLNHLVFADAQDQEAKELLAKTYDQLGYQAESGPWRDVYLTGALELRHGVSGSPLEPADAIDLLRNLPVERFFDAMASRVVGPEAAARDYRFNFVFTDLEESYQVTLENSVLNYRSAEPDPQADATVRLTREMWLRLVTQQAGLRDLLFSDQMSIEGSRLSLLEFFRKLETPTGNFPIVTP